MRLTLENAKKAGVAQYISAEVRDIKDFSNDGPFGCVICNPPYGERLLDVKTAEDIYRMLEKDGIHKDNAAYVATGFSLDSARFFFTNSTSNRSFMDPDAPSLYYLDNRNCSVFSYFHDCHMDLNIL